VPRLWRVGAQEPGFVLGVLVVMVMMVLVVVMSRGSEGRAGAGKDHEEQYGCE
jgi:hypothetical protein